MQSCTAVFRRFGISAVLAASLWFPAKLGAVDYVYSFTNAFSGASPQAASPWTQVWFHDVTNGTVSITISNIGLTGTEFISGLYLNLNTNYNPTSLSFQFIAGNGAVPTNILTAVNQFKADGDGKYDILFDFDESSSSRFEAGEYLTYQVTGISSLNALDFNYFSAPAGGAGPFLAAAHVQAIGTHDDSGWIRPGSFDISPNSVPEPSSATLLAACSGLALCVFRRKRSS